MILTIVLSFLAGVVGGNAFPHFVKGITRESFPNVFGGSPMSNLIAGWVGFLLAVALGCFIDFTRFPLIALGSIAVGVLLIGILHAGPGAFGRVPEKKAD